MTALPRTNCRARLRPLADGAGRDARVLPGGCRRPRPRRPRTRASPRSSRKCSSAPSRTARCCQAYLGMKGPDYGKWNDFSDEEAQRQDALNKQDLQRLRAEFDYDKLSEPMKVSYRIFEVQTQSSIDTFPWRFHGYAFQTQTNPVGQAATFMQNIHSVDSVEDAEAYVSRLNGVQTGHGAEHRRHERGRAPRHRADVLLLRPGDRRRPQRDHRRAVRRQRQGLGDPRRLPRQGGEARGRRGNQEAAARRGHRRAEGPVPDAASGR